MTGRLISQSKTTKPLKKFLKQFFGIQNQFPGTSESAFHVCRSITRFVNLTAIVSCWLIYYLSKPNSLAYVTMTSELKLYWAHDYFNNKKA